MTIPTIIARELGISPSQVEPGMLLCDLHADALHLAGIACSLDETFGIELSDNAIASWVTCGDIARSVEDARGRVGA